MGVLKDQLQLLSTKRIFQHKTFIQYGTLNVMLSSVYSRQRSLVSGYNRDVI
jgi:hypothetical protein